MKAKTSVSVDPELLKIAQEKRWNVSGMLEKALIDKYHMPEIDGLKELKCSFCGNDGKQESVEEALEAHREAQANDQAGHGLKFANPTRLTWLWPDEKFICNRCLSKVRNGIVV